MNTKIIKDIAKAIRADEHICPSCGCRSFVVTMAVNVSVNSSGWAVDATLPSKKPAELQTWVCNSCGRRLPGRDFSVRWWERLVKEEALTGQLYSKAEASNIAKAFEKAEAAEAAEAPLPQDTAVALVVSLGGGCVIPHYGVMFDASGNAVCIRYPEATASTALDLQKFEEDLRPTASTAVGKEFEKTPYLVVREGEENIQALPEGLYWVRFSPKKS